jgi:hypothetical protein
MRGNGEEKPERDSEYKFGQMEQNMKVNGKIIRLMAMGNFGMLMEIFMMVIFSYYRIHMILLFV